MGVINQFHPNQFWQRKVLIPAICFIYILIETKSQDYTLPFLYYTAGKQQVVTSAAYTDTTLY